MDVRLRLPNVHVPISIQGGYRVDHTRIVTGGDVRHTPDESNIWVPREGLSTRLHMNLEFDDTERFHWSISPASGVLGKLGFTLRHPAMGSHATLFSLTYRLAGYLSLPWAKDHVFALSAEGGWRGGDRAFLEPFTLSGVPPQNVLGDLLAGVQAPGVWLRGYLPDAFSGTAYHLVTGEYRLPLVRGRTGLDVLPFFIRDLHAALFVDAGIAYSGPFDLNTLREVRTSVGLELRMSLEILFMSEVNLRLGYARGLGPGGIDHVYFLMGPSP